MENNLTISGGIRLIIDFMEIKEKIGFHDSYGIETPHYFIDYSKYRGSVFSSPNKSIPDFVNKSKFHKSYDWLLPVMFKFRDLGLRHPIHNNLTQKFFHHLCYEKTSVEELFFQVVEAIDWYNENK